jgi:hypothetical protein
MERRGHGHITRYVAGCRCSECREANRVYRIADVARRTARLAADPTLAPHGKAVTYSNWGCRCAPCSTAHSARCRAYKLRRKAALEVSR